MNRAERAATQRRAGTELEWPSPLTIKSIVKYPSPVLRAANQRVAVFGEPLQKLADEMFNVMYQCGPAPPPESTRAAVSCATCWDQEHCQVP